MEQTPPDIFFVSRDDDYLRQLREEEDFWDGREETFSSNPASPAVQYYMNERLSGDPSREWYETIEDFRDFRRGCVFGAGPGVVESHLLHRLPELHLTIHDISRGALERLHQRLERDFPGRSKIQQVDLNFLKLAPDTYDLVVARSTLHHILNLEHLAFQTNRALTADGCFFMYDVVCESHFQFTEEKKRLMETLADATRDSFRPRPTFRWPDRANWAFSPFECARSGEILDIFGRYLEEQSVRTAGALITSRLWVEPPGVRLASEGKRYSALVRTARRAASTLRQRMRGRRIDPEVARSRENLMIGMDKVVSETGFLTPFLAFGIYHRRAETA